MAVYTTTASSSSFSSSSSHQEDVRDRRSRLSSSQSGDVSLSVAAAADNNNNTTANARISQDRNPTTHTRENDGDNRNRNPVQKTRNNRTRSHSSNVDDKIAGAVGAATASAAVHSQQEEQQDDDDDIIFLCRCETPKLFVELLQAFAKTDLTSHRVTGAAATSAGTIPQTTTQWRNNSFHSSLLSNIRRRQQQQQTPMTIFCNAQAMTIHSQSSNKQFQASMELPATFFQHYQLLHSPLPPPPQPNNSTGDGSKQGEEDLMMKTYDFTIHWQTFLQCLSVFLTTTTSSTSTSSSHHTSSAAWITSSQSSSLTMSYHLSTELLRLEWENGGGNGTAFAPTSIMATAALPGLETPESQEAAELSTAFQESPIQGRWLSSSYILKEAKNELELVPGATLVQVQFLEERPLSERATTVSTNVSRPQPCLRLVTKGYSSHVVVEIPGSIEFSQPKNNPNDNHDDHESDGAWDSSSHPSSPHRRSRHKIIHTYPLVYWRQALQPLDMAKETCISINQEGIMAIQHSIPVDNKHNSKGHTTNTTTANPSSDHIQEDAPPTLVFCDFLILPMIEQLQEEDDDTRATEHNNHNDYDDDEDEGDSMMESSGLKTQSSYNGNQQEQEDQSIEATQSQISHWVPPQEARRLGQSTTNNRQDSQDLYNSNRGTSLPIGSSDEKEDNDDDDHDDPKTALLAPKFPSLSCAIQDTPHSTMTQETVESMVAVAMRQRRRHDHRKRQRRWSNEQQQDPPNQQHRKVDISNSKDSQQDASITNNKADEDNDHSSVNLLEDSPPTRTQDHGGNFLEQSSKQKQQQRTRYYSSDDDDNHDEENHHYCSSPEIIYGES